MPAAPTHAALSASARDGSHPPALNPLTDLVPGAPSIIAGADGAIRFLDRNAIGRLA